MFSVVNVNIFLVNIKTDIYDNLPVIVKQDTNMPKLLSARSTASLDVFLVVFLPAMTPMTRIAT